MCASKGAIGYLEGPVSQRIVIVGNCPAGRQPVLDSDADRDKAVARTMACSKALELRMGCISGYGDTAARRALAPVRIPTSPIGARIPD